MKKTFIALGMAMGAFFALSSCSELELSVAPEIEPGETDFTIVASSAGVRTCIDGYQTSWVAGDGLTLWHAEAGSSTYIKDDKFTADAAGTETSFSGSLANSLNPASNYDWYAIYPYKAALASPAGDPVDFKGTHSMGPLAKAGHPYLLQVGNNSTAHISGTELAFAGQALNVPGDKVPSIDLKPVFSIVKVVVTNDSSDPLHVFSVSFTSPDNMIEGQYAIDFSGDEFTYSPKPTSTYDHVCLEVKPDSGIPTDGSAEFYFTLRPFTASEGDQLKVKVNGYEKTIDLTSDCTFSAGKVKTINFSYDETVTDLSGDYFFGTTHGSGDVYFAEARQYTRGQVEGGTNTTKIAAGHKVSIEGDAITADGCMAVCAADADATIENYVYTITKVTDGKFAGLYTVQNSDDKYLSYTAASGNDVGFTDELQGTDGANSYWAIGHDADGTDYIVAPYSSGNRVFAFLKDALRADTNDHVRMTIYPYLEFQRFPTLYKRSDYTVTSLPAKYYKLVTSELSDWTGKYLLVNDIKTHVFNGSLARPDEKNNYLTVASLGSLYDSTNDRFLSYKNTDAIYVDIHKCPHEHTYWATKDEAWTFSDKAKSIIVADKYEYSLCAASGIYFGVFAIDGRGKSLKDGATAAACNYANEDRYFNRITFDDTNDFAVINCISKKGVVTQLRWDGTGTGNLQFGYYTNFGVGQSLRLYRLSE